MGDDVDRLRADARAILEAGVQAADAELLVRQAVRREGERLRVHPKEAYNLAAFSRVIVAGAGKAAGPMAQGIEALIGDRITGGVIAVPQGTPKAHLPKRLEVVEAEHPVPGEGSLRAAQAISALASNAADRDLFVVLVSGGASSLIASPEEGLELEDLQTVWSGLLRSGLDIHEMNTARKHLSRLAGGKLARLASHAAVVSLILSDVPGDRLDSVGSGPTVADATTFEDVEEALSAAGPLGPSAPRVGAFLERAIAGKVPETVKPGDTVLQRVFNRIVGSNADAQRGAIEKALALGYRDAGDFRSRSPRKPWAEEAGAVGSSFGTYAAYLAETARLGYRHEQATAIVGGGEAPVKVAAGAGRGGRLSEFVLAAAEVVAGSPGAVVAAMATDGHDGGWEAAGAMADGETVARALAAGVDPLKAKQRSDTASVIEAAGGKFDAFASRTNVMDLYVALVGAPKR